MMINITLETYCRPIHPINLPHQTWVVLGSVDGKPNTLIIVPDVHHANADYRMMLCEIHMLAYHPLGKCPSCPNTVVDRRHEAGVTASNTMQA